MLKRENVYSRHLHHQKRLPFTLSIYTIKSDYRLLKVSTQSKRIKNKEDKEYRKMKITVSGETKEVKDGITISELISQENVETPEYVSVSVNEEFAQKSDFDTTHLKEGDVVEFLYFMGGGCM